VAAGFLNGSLGLGEATGPPISSMLYTKYGFMTSTELTGVLVGLFAIIFFIFNGHVTIFKKENQKDSDENFNNPKSPITTTEAKNNSIA
jgi:uncharacterized membrane protein YbhN (UPF0104 family)